MKIYDVAIFGAGVVGALQALQLAHAGFTVLLLDVAAESKKEERSWAPDLRVSAITLKSEEILEEFAIISKLEQRFGLIKRINVWEQNGHGNLSFDSLSIGRNYLGKIVENNLLLEIITAEIKTFNNIKIIRPFKFESINNVAIDNNVYNNIQINNGSQYYAKLIIGADGANSYLRSYFNFALNINDYNHSALVTTVYTERSHNNTAYQVFLPDGPLAFLPWRDPNCCSIVWSQAPENASYWAKCSTAEFLNKLQCYVGFKLGKISECDIRQTFPLIMRHAEKYYKDSCVLIGDAAHTIHPLAGQGLNLGIYDAQELTNSLIWARDHNYVINDSYVLKKYELQRKGHNQQLINLMSFFKNIYSYDNIPGIILRNFGMSMINRSGFLKKEIIKHAVGI